MTAVCSSMSIVLPLLTFGWGAGHDTIAREVAARLPQPWSQRLRGETLRQFREDNHYPDSFEPFPAERIGKEALEYLRERKITRRYDLHGDKGRAVAFCLLTRSLRKDQPDRALLWLACLAHSTADMAACNHDPVVHIATYGWCREEWGMRLPGGHSFRDMRYRMDLGWIEEEPWSRAIFAKQIEAAHLRASGSNADATLLEIMLRGARGTAICGPRGSRILSAAAEWTDTGSRRSGERLAEALSSLGAWAVSHTLRDFDAALRMAQAEQAPEVTEKVLAQYETAMAAFVETRLLETDRFTRPALTPSPAEGPRIGVVIEPCWRMNEGMFGFGDRVLAVQIVTALRRLGKNAVLLDVRRLLKQEPSSHEMSVLIVPARRCGSYHALKADTLTSRLDAYHSAGGKIVWIGGGIPPGALRRGMPKPLLTKGTDKHWPVPLETFSAGTLRPTGGEERKLARSCDGVGWHWPHAPYEFTPKNISHVKVLLTWRGAEGEKVVGAAWPKDRPSVAYLPEYALTPYLWTTETPAVSPLQLDLDAMGKDALTKVLATLNREPF